MPGMIQIRSYLIRAGRTHFPISKTRRIALTITSGKTISYSHKLLYDPVRLGRFQSLWNTSILEHYSLMPSISCGPLTVYIEAMLEPGIIHPWYSTVNRYTHVWYTTFDHDIKSLLVIIQRPQSERLTLYAMQLSHSPTTLSRFNHFPVNVLTRIAVPVPAYMSMYLDELIWSRDPRSSISVWGRSRSLPTFKA